jgi:AcrR family transcriptional regulator
MAVYTHFGGMPGLWRAVRQEGFTRLAERLAVVKPTQDPVRDLMALGAAYVSNALASPHLYRVMFDAEVDLEDPVAAAETFHVLVSCAARARRSGRFAVTCDPEAVATQLWAMGHGLTMLVLTGVLPRNALDVHAPAMATALFVSAGDDPDSCRRSVTSGWRTFDPPVPRSER